MDWAGLSGAGASTPQRQMAEAFRNQRMADALHRPRFDGAQVPAKSKAQLARDFQRLSTEAERVDFFDLANELSAFADACSKGNRTEMQALLSPSEVLSPEQLMRALSQQAHGIEEALVAARDPERAAWLATAPAKNRDLILTALASSGNFDFNHRMGGVMNGGGMDKMMSMINPGREERERTQLTEFEASDPMTKYHRTEEGGFLKSKADASAMTAWTQANEMGRTAWGKQKFWTAEMAWSRALDLLDDVITPREHAKILTNRSCVRILLGRRCRSTGVGYFKSSAVLLEAAAADAAKATHLDASWLKGATRHAEALAALGPFHRAMEACKILSKAVKIADELPQEERPSQQTVCDSLPAALASAKARAKTWCAVVKPGTAPDTAVREATEKLAKTIASGLALPHQEDTAAASISLGKQIAENVATIGAVLSAAYFDEAWNLARIDEEIPDKLQLELRKLAKLVPLTAVAQSPELKALVFMHAPWSVWSMDRQDRAAGVGETTPLAFGAPDPFEAHPSIHQHDPNSPSNMHMKESVARMSDNGLGGVDLGSFRRLQEMLRGPAPTSAPKDMTPHHLCAFTCTVLQRLSMSERTPPALARETLQRIVELHADDRGFWAGGEFIGLCLTIAAGIGKYGYVRAPHRTHEFLRTPGGVARLAREITASGDETEAMQQALQSMTPQDWAQASPLDVQTLLVQYLFGSMDGEVMSLKDEDKFTPYVAAILGNVLEGYPSMLDFLSGKNPGGDFIPDTSSVMAFRPLYSDQSAFGAFVLRQFGKHVDKLKSKSGGSEPEVVQVTRSLVKKWRRLSPEDKAGYRWTTLDDNIKESLAHMKPTNPATGLASGPATAGEGEGGGDPTTRRADGSLMSTKAREIPACAMCGMTDADAVCVGLRLLKCSKCKVVQYCSADCQAKGWPGHKAACKALRAQGQPQA